MQLSKADKMLLELGYFKGVELEHTQGYHKKSNRKGQELLLNIHKQSLSFIHVLGYERGEPAITSNDLLIAIVAKMLELEDELNE